MTTLYGWGPMFELPGPSPFVMKADIQLQMLGVSFDRVIANLESVAKHKAPYVEDDGATIQDSNFIRFHFERKRAKNLDQELTPAQRGQAWAVERLLEDRLSLIMTHERWLDDANFNKGPVLFFMGVPEPARQQVIDSVRGEIAAMMKGHGIGRHSREERMQLAARDIAAAAAILADKPYLFGPSPTAADAAAFGVLASCGTRYFASPLADMIDQHANLRPYLARLQAQFFRTGQWPSMAA